MQILLTRFNSDAMVLCGSGPPARREKKLSSNQSAFLEDLIERFRCSVRHSVAVDACHGGMPHWKTPYQQDIINNRRTSYNVRLLHLPKRGQIPAPHKSARQLMALSVARTSPSLDPRDPYRPPNPYRPCAILSAPPLPKALHFSQSLLTRLEGRPTPCSTPKTPAERLPSKPR